MKIKQVKVGETIKYLVINENLSQNKLLAIFEETGDEKALLDAIEFAKQSSKNSNDSGAWH